MYDITASCNVHAKAVAERLGHASIRMTLDTYSHLIPGMQTEAATVLGDVLGGTAISLKSETKPKLRALS